MPETKTYPPCWHCGNVLRYADRYVWRCMGCGNPLADADAVPAMESMESMESMEATIAACLAVCRARGWSLHWTARGAYLHLEASELIEAWRGKGTSSVADEAGDLLLVLFSILGAANVPWADALDCARRKIADLQTRPRYPGEEYSADV